MSEISNSWKLNAKQQAELQGLFLWLRLAATLFFVASFWQLVIALGLLFSLSWSGLFQLLVGLAIAWLGGYLWRASKLFEQINAEITLEQLHQVLTQFARFMLLFFKWFVVGMVVITSMSLLLMVIGFLRLLTSGQWTSLSVGG